MKINDYIKRLDFKPKLGFLQLSKKWRQLISFEVANIAHADWSFVRMI